MSNGTITSGVSRETVSKWLVYLIPVVISLALTWTTLQLSLQALRFQVDGNEKRIAVIEDKDAKDTKEQIEQLRKINETLQEKLNERANAAEQKKR